MSTEIIKRYEVRMTSSRDGRDYLLSWDTDDVRELGVSRIGTNGMIQFISKVPRDVAAAIIDLHLAVVMGDKSK